MVDTCLTQFCLYVVEPWNYSWKGGRGLILLTLYMNGTIGQIKKQKQIKQCKCQIILYLFLFFYIFREQLKRVQQDAWVHMMGKWVYLQASREWSRSQSNGSVSGQSLRSAGDTWTLERHNFGLFGLDFLHGNVHILMVCTHVVGQPGECHRVGWRERWKMLQDTSERSHIFTWLNRRNLF